MARGRRKKAALVSKNSSEDENYFNSRRSSMKVNLSYVSSFSDSENCLLKKTTVESNDSELSVHSVSGSKKVNKSNAYNVTLTPSSSGNITVINVDKYINNKGTEEISCDNSLSMIKQKEQLLNKSCENLKNAIMSKTKAIFDTENELALKISEVLEPGLTLRTSPAIHDDQDLRSPSIRVNIGKNDQIVMSGDGRKKNPVQVNTMQKVFSQERENQPSSQSSAADDMECKSIASTPKISTIEKRNKSFHKTAEKLRIPVARLFADDDDEPNNSLSHIEPIKTVNNLPKSIADHEKSAGEVSVSEKSNELNYTTSPILSQGNRKNRISRLSLKKKVIKTLTETNKTNESFFGRKPLTCSSFIEKQDKVKSKPSTETSQLVELEEKSKSMNNGVSVTIDLVNERSSKTIEIDNSTEKSSSIMDITAISSNMPIVKRTFQHIIRRSLNLDNVATTQNTGKKFLNTSVQKQTSVSVDKKKETINSSKSSEDVSKHPQKDDCTNTDFMSLNVNTSLDPISSDDHSGQKENKIPNDSREISNHSKNEESENNTLILRQSSSNGSSKEEITLSSSEKKLKNSNSNILDKNKIKEKIRHQQKEKDVFSQPSTSTGRCSLQVNTSLDSVKKSSVSKNTLDYNKILSMVEENSSNEIQSKISEYSKNQSSSSDSEIENVSLIERIRNISATLKVNNSKKKSMNISKKRKSESEIDDPNPPEDFSGSKSVSSKLKKKSFIQNKKVDILQKSGETKNMSNNSSGESSIVETTPFPASRSFLLKTMIKNSIATNTLNPRKFIDFTDEEDSIHEQQTSTKKSNKNQNIGARKKTTSESSSDTVIMNSSDESDQEKEKIIIDETLNETRSTRSKKDQEFESKVNKKNKQATIKRKLYPLRENSQISFSSMMDMEVDCDSQKDKEKFEKPAKHKKRKIFKKKKIEKKKIINNHIDSVDEISPVETEIIPKPTKKVIKKPRKIVSKKIVVKKTNNMTILDDLMENNKEAAGPRFSNRSSLNEFDLKKRRSGKNKYCKNHKIVIVATGVSNEDKSLVKSVIKTLGSAVLETSVTPRTTHVVSAGTRTINLLKGIIRGCWLLSMEWVLKSLENEHWLEPGPYEMVHFSKAVQENRRDRQLFGKAYIPELFVTCGFIYIENGTSPPTSVLKELVKTAGGRITENPDQAQIEIGRDGLKEIWILDSITTGELQPIDDYERS